jgi:hypothetical protein
LIPLRGLSVAFSELLLAKSNNCVKIALENSIYKSIDTILLKIVYIKFLQIVMDNPKKYHNDGASSDAEGTVKVIRYGHFSW